MTRQHGVGELRLEPAPHDGSGRSAGPGRRPWPAGLLAVYPAGWRARYGGELELLISDLHDGGRNPVPMALDLLRGAAIAWLSIRRGSAMPERTRNTLITVLWSWVGFAVTAAWFGHDLGIYPSRSAARQIALAHPAVPDAVNVLVAVGVVGLAVTAVAAVAFAFEAARYARKHQHNSTFGLMAVPPVVAVAWIAGLQVITNGSGTGGSVSTGRLTLELLWFLLGLAGIAGSTQAIAAIVARTEFSPTTWRIGAAAAAAISAAMLVGTGASIVWGLAIRSTQAHPGSAAGWLVVTAILSVTTARAVIALIGSRRHTATPEPAVA